MRPRIKAGGKTHCAFYQQQCSKESSFSHVAGRVPWCSLAYWEERRRVGRLSPVFSPGVEVFAVQPKPPPIGDALSLAQLAQGANHRPSEATLRTREKIGLGNTSFWMMQNQQQQDFHTCKDYLVTYRHMDFFSRSYQLHYHDHMPEIVVSLEWWRQRDMQWRAQMQIYCNLAN